MRTTLAPPVVDAPAVERELALDMVRRGLWVAPVLVLLGALGWGGDGAWSTLLAIGVVLANLTLSALSLSWAARISPAALAAAAFGGFVIRMGVVVAVIAVVRDEPWVDLTALAVGVLVTHLGLLFWELRYVSASLAYPGLRPDVKEARAK